MDKLGQGFTSADPLEKVDLEKIRLKWLLCVSDLLVYLSGWL